MRLRTVGMLTFFAGLFLFVWGVLAVMAAVAGVSGGGSGAHPVGDFAIEHFLSGGPIVALVGLVMWLVGPKKAKPESGR